MKRIVIASALKPVTEARMYERFALSLAKANKYDINIIGIPTKKLSASKYIKFYPIPDSGRIIHKRIANMFRILFLCIRINPKLIVITSPELFLLAILKFRGIKLVYDVQENYVRNLLNQNVYPPVIRQILAIIVRSLEWLLSPLIDHYFLAEVCYQNELSFLNNRYSVLENKVVAVETNKELKEHSEPIRFLFSGMISNYSGIMNAINLFEKITIINPKATLLIIGYAPSKPMRKMIRDRVKTIDNIILKGLDYFIEHDEINRAIKNSDIGIVGYLPDKINAQRMPSKVFEYCYFKLPFLIEKNTYWETRAKTMGHPIGIHLNDLESVNSIDFTKKIKNVTDNPDRNNASWNTEESKLIISIDHLLKNS